MLSSNNRNEYLRKQEPKKQRFAIKKLTVGVASVLIGFTFMGLSASASADENAPAPAATETLANQTGDDNTPAAGTPAPQAADTPSSNEGGQATTQNQSQGSGINIPESEWLGSESSKYTTLNMQTGTLNNNTDTSLPFKVTSRIYGGNTNHAKDYQLRIQIDDRLAPYVKDIKVSQQGDINAKSSQVTLTREGDSNVWSAPLFKLYGGTMGLANVDVPYSNPNCVIDFNDQIQNFWKNLGDLSANPLQYAIYGYDSKTGKTIGNYQSVGYIVSQGSSYDLPIATGTNAYKPGSIKQPYYQGAQMTLMYDHATNTIHVFYNPQMLGNWTWDTAHGQQRIDKLNYQVDPRLVPFIKSQNIIMHNIQAGGQTKLYNDNGTPYTGNKVVNSTNLSIGAVNTDNTGKGTVEVTSDNMSISGIMRQNHLVEISYQLNTPLGDIINQLGLKSSKNNRLQFGAYFTAANGDMAPHTLATNAYDIIAQETLADQYTPDGGTISVAENHTLDGTDAANGITNKDQLVDKDGNSVVKTDGYTWKVTPDTKTPGDKAGVVTVTYTDGSTDDVPVVVHVQSQAETNNPQGQDINVNKGETQDAEQGISNKDQMPKGTGYHWPDGQTPDTSKPGKVPATVIVTYPDGSKDVVPTTIIVKDPSATPSTDKTVADKNDPKGQTVDTTLGNVPDAEKAISNTGDLPKGTKYEWSQTPNVYSKGEHPGVVKVSYPDGSVDYVPASVNVTNEPTGKTVTTPKGTVPKADTTIDWGNGTEPDGTTVEWQTEPDVSTPGTHPGTVKITYPDGENTTVPVNVVVPDDSSTANKDFNPYGTTIDVPYGHKMDSDDAQKAIAGGVPADAKNVSYDWATSVDTTKPGLTQAYVKVTATIDGQTQTKTVPVYVKVGTQAENYNPEGQNLTVKKGDAVPDPKTAISNADKLPADAKYTWAITPDTSTVGTQSVLVKVTYPDNSVDYVPVNVTVKDNLSDADKYQPEYAPVSVEPGTTATAKPTWSTENGNEGEPTGETFAAVTKGDNQTPDWASVAPDGTVTLNPEKTQTPGDYLIPVTVTYADGTSEVVNVPVVVKGATQDDNKTTYYGDQSTVTYTLGEYTTHKTSDGSADVTAPSIVEIEFKNQDHSWKTINSVTYKLQGDKYVATTPITDAKGNPIELQNGNKAPESFAASDVTTAWMNDNFTPNTNVDNFKDSSTGTSTAQSQYTNPDGEQRTDKTDPTGLVGNSKARVNITLSGQAQSYFGGASWCNAFGNIYGATTGEALTFKQNQDISNLTQDQYRHLIDVTDLGAAGWNGQNINPNAPQVLAYVEGTDAKKQFTMTWAPNGQPSTATVANGVKGVVRIIFNDGTYLDVPAAINVIADPDSGKTDQEKTEFSQKIIYTYNGKEVATTSINNIKKGSDVSADTLKSTIDGNVPSNYTIADGYTYPAGLTNVTATPDTIEVPLTLKRGENFDMAGKLVYQTQDGKSVNDGKSDVDIKSNKGDTLTAALLHDLADKNLPSGYEIVTYPGSFNVTENNFTIPVIVKNSEAPHTTTDAEKYTPSYKDTTVNAKSPVNTGAPTFTEAGQSAQAPQGTTYSFDNGQTTKEITDKKGNNPVEVKIDANTGAITFTAPDEATEYDVPVTVNYPDHTSDSTTAKVFVNKTLDPTDPTINPNNPGKNSDMFAKPTRTINVTDPNTGAINTTKQTVWFGRTKTVYGNGKATKYGDWELGKVVDGHFVIDANANSAWPEFDAPTFDGYTPSQAKVDAQTVEATTGDTEVNITYTKTDNGNHDNGGNTTPTTGDNGDHNNGNSEGNGNGNGIANNNGSVKNTNNGANNNANNNKHALPQTGNDQSAAVAGLGLAGLTTMLGLAGLKKRKND